MPTAKSTQTAMYKVGDYICTPSTVFLKIAAVINDEHSNQPVYLTTFVNIAKSTSGQKWCTQFELDDEGNTKQEPDFAAWQNIAVDDTIKTGYADDRGYVKVIARLGDAVLLSQQPHDHTKDDNYKLANQLANLMDKDLEEVIPKQVKDELRQHNSMRHMHNIADQWFSVEHLALMNWQIIKD